MKRKIAVLAVMAFILSGCAMFQTAQSRTETVVISYESLATVAFPTVLAYLQQREKNGSLVGQDLTNAKAKYATAKAQFIQAGEILKQYINNPTPNLLQQFPILLKQIAIMLADLSGGSVQGNTMTVPQVGGKS